MFQKKFHHFRVAVLASQGERRNAISVCGIDVRARFDERFRRLEIVDVNRAIQRRQIIR